ncbi:DEAD/DEAH box helicase family protein [Rhodococcus pyridinivorans]
MAEISPSIDEFVVNGGSMRLITSPSNLSDDDLSAMGKGEHLRTILEADLANAIQSPIPQGVLSDRLRLLTWMIATGRLEVRIALREHPECYSLFHEKIGVFADQTDCWMTFTGSPNETVSGALRHSESFPLHRSWANEDQHAYATEERDRFEQLWNEQVSGITTWTANAWIEDPMREAFGTREPRFQSITPIRPQEKITKSISHAEPSVMIPRNSTSLLPSLPTSLGLRDFQREAVNGWLRASGRGTFAMATGTGKTITALTAATQASIYTAQHNQPLLVLVVVPSVDLVEQWNAEAKRFGFRPAKCTGTLRASELRALKSAFSAARFSKGRRTEMVITTAGSLVPRTATPGNDSHFLQHQLDRHRGPLMVIGDEMHSLGTPPRLAALPKEPQFTLGLSATPKRHGDETGTKELLDYFGSPVISIDIKDAIYQHKALVPYDYLFWPIELTSEETREYKIISQRIASAYARGEEEVAERHIRARTRLTQHASNKITLLRELLADGLSTETHQLVYVAEGKNPETDVAQLDEVEALMRDEFGMRVARYYGPTPGDRREDLQLALASGDIQSLIAMKCLDEGVDIPSARTGIMMASTQNPRQFVQRRGRLLRRDHNSPKSHAVIHDMVVMPPEPMGELSESEKRLVGVELSRAAELADAARNAESRFKVIELAYNYNLDPETYPWMTLAENEEMQEWLM